MIGVSIGMIASLRRNCYRDPALAFPTKLQQGVSYCRSLNNYQYYGFIFLNMSRTLLYSAIYSTSDIPLSDAEDCLARLDPKGTHTR